MSNRQQRVKGHRGKHPHQSPNIKVLALLIHLVGLLIFFMQQPEVREIVRLLLAGKL